MDPFYRLFIAAWLTLGVLPAQVEVTIDWPTKALQNFPTRVEPPIRVKVTVKDVNDYLYSYRGNITVDPAAATSVSASQLGFLSSDKCKTIDDTAVRIEKFVKADFILKEVDGKYPSIPMETSRAAWRTNLQADYTIMEGADAGARSCPGWKSYAADWRLTMQKLAKADAGKHEYPFESTISENGKVTVTIKQYYMDKVTADGEQNFVFQAESGRFFLSVGFLATQVQARSYDVVDVGVIKGTPAVPAVGSTPAVPAVPDQTKKELRIQGTGTFRPTAAVLLNYKIPLPALMGPKYGLALSAGPVYRIAQNAGTSTASNWGMFVGASLHLWERLWITPGFHVGEFSDLPRGFTASDGLRIPEGFPSSFSGVNRFTTRFGVGITFRAADFKAAASVLANEAPAGSGGATTTGRGLPGTAAATGGAPAAATAASTGGAAAPAPATGTIASEIVKLREKIATAQKTVKDAETRVTEKDAARQSAMKLKSDSETGRDQKKASLDSKTTSQKNTLELVRLAREGLLAATAADRPAAQAALDDAQKKLQEVSEEVGAAKAQLQAAEAAVTASQDVVIAATAQSTEAIATLAKAKQELATLEAELKEICKAVGGCQP